jgi:hypothetical protein
MRLSINETVFVGLGVTVIIAFSSLFYYDITKKISGSGELIGTVTFKRKTAQRKYSSRVVWEDVSQDMPVYNNDSLRTSDLSEAVIRLNDGTEIRMDESSMILLSYVKDGLEIDFAQGSIKADRGNVKDANLKNLNIKSGETKVALGKSDVSVSRDMGRDLSLTVNKGTARVKIAGDKEEVINENQKVIASLDELRVFDIKIKLLTPVNNKNFITPSPETRVEYSWEPVGKNFELFLETSATNSFSEIFMKNKPKENRDLLLMKKGIYYWRIKAVELKTKKIEYSEVRRFSIITDEEITQISPAKDETIKYRDKLPSVSFIWSTSDIASSYNLKIYKDPLKKEILKSVQTQSASAVIDEMKPGSYFWQVEKESTIEGAGNLLPGKISKFNVAMSAKVNGPDLMYPPDKKVFNSQTIKKNPPVFSWKVNPEISKYRLYVSSDMNFKGDAETEETENNYLKYNKEIKSGKYYWRSAGVLKNGDLTEYSAPRSFDVIDLQKIDLAVPVNGANLVSGDSGELIPVDFSWKKGDIEGNFILELSRDEFFSAIYKKSSGKDFTRSIDISPGKYFWRVRLENETGSETAKSPSFSFTAYSVFPLPSATTPVNGAVVDMMDIDALIFRWNGIKDANLYRVGLYMIKGGRAVNIVQKETAFTTLGMKEFDKLDVGNFYWTLQAFETDQAGKKIIRKSPEARFNFKIKLRELEKPKIKTPKILIIGE